MKLKKFLALLLVLLAISFAGFWVYVQVRTYPAEPDYLDAIMADQRLKITEERGYYLIAPAGQDPAARPVIYYPGGLVAPEAYLYKLGQLALELNTAVFLIKAPFNAAIFNTGAAGPIITDHGIEAAWVGGHSLGGIAACRYLAANPENIYGIFLFGSYCDRDISGFAGPVVSIMGLEDLIINRGNYTAAKAYLPGHANVIELENLNHSAFGHYGLQKGDGQNSLTDQELFVIISSALEK